MYSHKLRTSEQAAGELISHVEDLLAICGGRDYVFYLDAAVVDRFCDADFCGVDDGGPITRSTERGELV